jgi:putative alpha-1,2-mannosidase
VEEVYTTTQSGLPGNDDYGTMSAWLIFASMGFYPRAGCPEYVVGSPLFNNIKIMRKMINGGYCELEIEAHNNSKKNYYVEKIEIDGVEV